MNANVDKTQVRRYLLGALAEAEQLALEAKYFSDSETFEQIWALENELVDEYVRGSLPTDERVLFEHHYLATPKHQQRVASARQLLQAADASIVEDRVEDQIVNDAPPTASLWTNLLAFFQTPQFALGGAVALLLLVFGSWWFWRTAQNEASQMAQTSSSPVLSAPSPTVTTPRPTVSPSETPSPTAQPSASARTAAPTMLAFTLLGAVVRDADKIQNLNIPTDTQQVQLKMNLTDEEYPRYQIKLRTVAGKELLTHANLRPAANKKSVVVSIPGDKLPQGDYFLALSGVSEANETEELITYFFRVTRK